MNEQEQAKDLHLWIPVDECVQEIKPGLPKELPAEFWGAGKLNPYQEPELKENALERRRAKRKAAKAARKRNRR